METFQDVRFAPSGPLEVFRKKYARTVEGLFDMRHYFDNVVAGLAPQVRHDRVRSRQQLGSGDAARGPLVQLLRVRQDYRMALILED